MMKITYKNASYSWEEWQQQHREFVNSLEQHNDFTDYVALSTILHMYDESYAIAVDRLYALHELLGTAKFSLWNSYKKFYSDILYSSENYLSHLLRRSHYLKNAIVWYNSCEDYVYQIISLSYELHGVKITGSEQYKTALKRCNYSSINKKLKKIDTKESKELLQIINAYRFNDDVVYLRDQLANNLKHHGNLQFEGIAVGKPGAFTKTDAKTKQLTYNSLWTESDVVDIDEVIDLMGRVHNLLVKHTRKVIDFIDFNNAKPEEKVLKNEKEWWVTKEVSDYRKIVFQDVT